MRHNRLAAAAFTAIAVTPFFLGCGDGRPALVPVTGTVTFDGKPIQGAEVMFMVKGGRPARGETDAEGHFALSTFEEGDGCTPGAAQVVVQKQSFHYNQKGEGITTYLIPQKYGIPGQSGLDVEVIAGSENDFPLELKSR